MKIFFVITAFFVLMFRCSAVVSGDDFNANTTTALTSLQQWYDSSGLWTSTGWWNAANCIDAVETGIVAVNGQNYMTILPNTFALNDSKDFEDSYYDDDGWWTEAWIKAYDLTGDVLYLNMAKTIFTNVTSAWDSECGGGCWWSTARTYKNAIPNELFLLNAIRLHERTPNDGAGTGSFYYWATNEWAWFSNSGMINSSHLINDGLTSNCVNNGETTWTYNQGVILGGLVDLFKVTGNSNYLTEAETLANASMAKLQDNGVLQEPCEPTGCGGGDVPQFKGIYMRHLAELYDVDHKSAYYNFIYTNAHSVWFNDRNSANQLGLKWTGPFDTNDAARQSSAIIPISALAEPSTALLFYARGSGDPAFNHAIGQAAGSLAWSCSPAISSASGYMQSGPYLNSLPAGIHTVHFRAAVNTISNSATTLAQFIILNNGATVVSSNVPWSAFVQANEPQDFALTFTNSAYGNQQQFEAYWNYSATAPTLTLSDITIDGAHNWTAANLSHTVGRLDGMNAWEADPVRDTSSGYLVTGPGTAELGAGRFVAQFELKVDNFNWDNSAVAILSVVNSDANTVVASQSITRGQFPDALYHTFSLTFQATAGVHYNFCTYWNYAPNAPRLTQRSVVVAAGWSPVFYPIPLTPSSYNQDMVVENTAPAAPLGEYTTASMDAGVTNTGTSWYEAGYDASAPETGLPAAGSTITNEADTNSIYTFASDYTEPNVAFVDATHPATMTPATPTAFSALSFLGAAGHGPVFVNYTVTHAGGNLESGALDFSDWFNNSPVIYLANGRINVVTGAFSSVNENEPNLYAQNIALNDTTSAVTQINLTWDTGTSGNGVAAIFAVSGAASATTTTLNSPAPSTYGQLVTFTATVAPTPAGGTMQFFDNGNPLGSPAVVYDGEATFLTSELSIGSHAVTAAYSGTNGFPASSNASPTIQQVNPAPLSITANAQTKMYGTQLNFGPGGGLFASSGLQNFETIGSVTLTASGNGGTTGAPVGTYTITPSAATGGTFSPANYNITYYSNTLTVTLPSNTIPVTISGVSILTNGSVAMNFNGTPGYVYLIESATNLLPPIIWTILSTNAADTNGDFTFTDSNAVNYSARYYRTAIQ